MPQSALERQRSEQDERARKERLVILLREKRRRQAQRNFYRLFPDETTGPDGGSPIHARSLYPKHLEHFAAGAIYRERMFRAANRVGKTVAGAFEVSAHATGEYRNWWEGRRFDHPIKAWVAGKTGITTRDIVQDALFGQVLHQDGRRVFSGTGIIPGNLIGAITWAKAVPDLVDTVKIKHVPTGDWSTIGVKTYEQGRGSFEGTAQHVIWFDEEPPQDVYGEAVIRTMTTKGIVIVTFTPLEGMSEVVMGFMPKGERPSDA